MEDYLLTNLDIHPHPENPDHTEFGAADFIVFKLEYAESHLNGEIIESDKLELIRKRFDLTTLDPRFDCKGQFYIVTIVYRGVFR